MLEIFQLFQVWVQLWEFYDDFVAVKKTTEKSWGLEKFRQCLVRLEKTLLASFRAQIPNKTFPSVLAHSQTVYSKYLNW